MQYAGAAGPGSWRGRGRRGWPLCLRGEGEQLQMIRNCSGKLEKGRIGISVTFPQFHSQQNILHPTRQFSVSKAPREHLNCILVFSFIVFQGFTV